MPSAARRQSCPRLKHAADVTYGSSSAELAVARPSSRAHGRADRTDSVSIILKHIAILMNARHFSEYDARRDPAQPFEWEELPSLSNVVLRRHVPAGSYGLAAKLVADARSRLRSLPSVSPVWMETAPAALDPLQPSEPLHDTVLDGLASREIVEPDVFKHFFGAERRHS